MMDLKTFVSQMLTPGTVPCTLFGAALGLIFAVLCLTVGVGPALLIALLCLIGAFIEIHVAVPVLWGCADPDTDGDIISFQFVDLVCLCFRQQFFCFLHCYILCLDILHNDSEFIPTDPS